MKFKKADLLILVIPIIIMILLTPILPARVPVHWAANGAADGFIDRKYSFVIGIMPFIIYKLMKLKYSIK